MSNKLCFCADFCLVIATNILLAIAPLFMLVEGSVEITMQGKTFQPAINGEILIPAGVKHSVRNNGDTENCWYYGYKEE